jgi:hypothetical protein
LEYRPRYRATLVVIFRVSLQSLRANTGTVPRACHDGFLPNTFQLIIRQSFYNPMLYSLATDCVENKPQEKAL